MTPYGAADLAALVSVCRGALGGDLGSCRSIEGSRWSRILAAAFDHGLVGPLHAVCSALFDVHEPAFQPIRDAQIAQAVSSLRLADALLDILQRFRASQIDVLVLKGPAAALITSGTLSAREFTDLDLLVRPADFRRARQVLQQAGYEHWGKAEPTLPRHEKDMQFYRASDGLLVELHWAVNPSALRFQFENTGIWDRAQTLEYQGRRIPTLSLEDTLFALAVHGTKHGWSSLKWSFDVAQILRHKRHQIDWSGLIRLCQQTGSLRMLLIGVRLACEVFGEDPPEPLVHKWNDEAVVDVVGGIHSAIRMQQPLRQRDIIAAQIRGHDRMRDRLAVMVTMSVPELPRLLPQAATPVVNSPVRYLTRPLRLLNRYGPGWVWTAVSNR